jgi:hypothetical protein
MKQTRTLIYKNTPFEDFLIIYLNRFPNDIIPEITNVKITKKEESPEELKFKSIITIHDESPKILKKFGISMTTGEIKEKTSVFYDKKTITSIAKNITLSTLIQVVEKELIQEIDGNIVWKSTVKINSFVPGASNHAINKYHLFKESEKEIN